MSKFIAITSIMIKCYRHAYQSRDKWDKRSARHDVQIWLEETKPTADLTKRQCIYVYILYSIYQHHLRGANMTPRVG